MTAGSSLHEVPMELCSILAVLPGDAVAGPGAVDVPSAAASSQRRPSALAGLPHRAPARRVAHRHAHRSLDHAPRHRQEPVHRNPTGTLKLKVPKYF